MSNFDNTNTGALWVQTEKKSEKSPDVKGKINIDGVDYPFVGWRKFTPKGEMFSLQREKPKPEVKTEDTTDRDQIHW